MSEVAPHAARTIISGIQQLRGEDVRFPFDRPVGIYSFRRDQDFCSLSNICGHNIHDAHAGAFLAAALAGAQRAAVVRAALDAEAAAQSEIRALGAAERE